jgi:HAD superfamily hydrolase (TIGR01509 family)
MTTAEVAELLSGKRLLIFDFDGTLVDSSPLHARAFDEAFAPWNLAVDYSTIAGMTTEAAVDKIAIAAGLTFSDADRQAVVREKRARARLLIESELAPIAGSVDFVRAAARRFALALCTSGSRATVDVGLARVGLGGYFRPLVTAEDVSRSKPDPEGFLKVVAAHAIPAAQALVFEDAENGLAAAAAAGLDVIRIVAPDVPPAPGQAGWTLLNEALLEGVA